MSISAATVVDALRADKATVQERKKMWRCLVAFLLLFAADAEAKDIWSNGRPVNFYQMSSEPEYASIANRDPVICARVLKALNKPYKPADMNKSTNTNVAADILLSSELEIEWRRAEVLNPGGKSELGLKFAPAVDLANNGRPQVIALIPRTDATANDLAIFDHLPEQLRSRNPLDPRYESVRRLLEGGVGNFVEIYRKPEFQNVEGRALFHDVIFVEGRVEILATPAYDANEAVWEARKAHVEVYVLDYQSKETIPVLCRFESKEEATKKRGVE
jgi:hypothetical protein